MEKAVILTEVRQGFDLLFLQFISYQSVWEVDNTKTMYGVTPATEQKTPESLKITDSGLLFLLTD